MKKVILSILGLLLFSLPLYAANAPVGIESSKSIQKEVSVKSEAPFETPAVPVAVTTTDFLSSASAISKTITVAVSEGAEKIQQVLTNAPAGATVALTGEGVVNGTKLLVPEGVVLQCNSKVTFIMTQGFEVRGTLIDAIGYGGPLASSVTGTIINSYSTGSITTGFADTLVGGGLVGVGGYVDISNNYSTGTVSGVSGSGIGGLIQGSTGSQAGGSINIIPSSDPGAFIYVTYAIIPVRAGMEPAVTKLQKATSLANEMLALLRQSPGSKTEERALWKKLDRMWVDVKESLSASKKIVQKAGDKALSREISTFLARAQSQFRIACEQSLKQKDHQKAIDFLQGFQNQVSNLQTKLYGTV